MSLPTENLNNKRGRAPEDGEEVAGSTTKKPKYDLEEVLKLMGAEAADFRPEYIEQLWIESEENIDLFNAKVQEQNPQNIKLTCECCFNEELPLNESVECTKQLHMFCKDCVKKCCETTVAHAEAYPKCMASDCTGSFDVETLDFLPQQMQQNLLQKQQLAEIAKAKLRGLQSCPFCYFSYVPGRNDTEFECLNEECGKKSCLKCKELSHAPKICADEQELVANHKVAEAMTEELLCKCPKCSKAILKTEGCNKVTCVCGAYICYICKQQITGYEHFNNGTCQQTGGTRTDADIKAAGKKVQEKLAQKSENDINADGEQGDEKLAEKPETDS